MKELLIKLNACEEAVHWAGDKTWEEIYKTCHRGDWLLWLHNHTNKEDVKIRTLAKGHCTNTVRRLMKDERSLNAVDTAIAFGEGRASFAELKYAAYAAKAASVIVAADVAAADAADAAYADAAYASAAYASAAYAAVDASHAAAAAADAADARAKNQKETADIVRKYIPIELWNVQKMIDELNNNQE